MNLTVATPFQIVVEAGELAHLFAEDETGAFGILPGHADFLTVLIPSVVTWRERGGGEHHLAVRGGMLSVEGGKAVTIATPEAIQGDDLRRLEAEVVETFRRGLAEEERARADSLRLALAAMREIARILRPERTPGMPPARAGRWETLEP